ncbi:hypothetical protein M1N79_03010 [Dehalococcoidia bacterium]|nr:hypothetical protein [Dehalococcoidia bacterium]
MTIIERVAARVAERSIFAVAKAGLAALEADWGTPSEVLAKLPHENLDPAERIRGFRRGLDAFTKTLRENL